MNQNLNVKKLFEEFQEVMLLMIMVVVFVVKVVEKNQMIIQMEFQNLNEVMMMNCWIE